MTKGSDIYAGLQIYNWIQAQDFPAKFSKLAKKKQASFEALAAEICASNKVEEEPALEVPKPEASPEHVVKKHKVTGYTIYKMKFTDHIKKKNLEKVPAAEIRAAYKALEPVRRKHYEEAATNMNVELEKDVV